MSKHIVFIEMSLTGAGEKAVEYAVNCGYEVTIVSRTPHKYDSTILKTAKVFECDTNDLEQLAIGICKLNDRKKIDGITTTADFYVPQAAYAAEKLHLISMSYDAAVSARNKYLMRLRLQEHCPHLNPPFRLVNSVEEALDAAGAWGYPIIAKPLDANDSLNVRRIKSPVELEQYMEEAKNWGHYGTAQDYAGSVLLEGYIEGEEYSIETVQHKNGDIQCMGVTGKVLIGGERGFFVEAGVLFPIRTPEADLLYKEVAQALGKLQIDCGVIHTECRIKDGNVKILEINPRLMGDMAGSHMIEAALGANPIQQVVEIALGNEVPWKPLKEEGAAMFGAIIPSTGIFAGIENLEEIQRLPGVQAIKIVAEEGQRYLNPPESNGDMLLRLVTGAETPEKALKLAMEAAAAAKIKVLS